ncbi:hypothetical protein [Streptomyces sp. AC495_CC817]|uniref:hypothetical protein n=1 Tax=Streptomyces sp. AC495_CC817 TaxID=2823900 RepID=UPI001C26BFF1|nr:hypothetical protein [Streptomyces sp. AC495_CC817]
MNPYNSAPAQPSPAPPSSPARPWWRTTRAALGILALVAFVGAFSFPLGFLALIAAVVLMWVLPPWRWFAKLGASIGALFLLTIGSGLGGQLDDADQAGARNDAKSVAEASGTPSPKASPSPAAEPEVPNYRGKPLDDAEADARDSGYTTGRHDASAEDRSIVLRSGWVVCFQKADHDDGRKLIDFAAVKRGEPCPKKDGAKIPWPTMPDLLERTWRDSVTVLTDLGVDEDAIHAEAYYLNDDLAEGDHDTWLVCEQDPEEGADITAEVTLGLAHPEVGCSTDGPYLGDKDDDGRPDYRDRTDDRDHTDARDTGSSGGSGTTGGSSTSGGSSSTGGSSTGGGGAPVVHPGSFCSPPGATGVTSAGTPMVCGPGSDGRNRWRSA